MAYLRYSRALFSRHGRGEGVEGHPLASAVEVMSALLCSTLVLWVVDFALNLALVLVISLFICARIVLAWRDLCLWSFIVAQEYSS